MTPPAGPSMSRVPSPVGRTVGRLTWVVSALYLAAYANQDWIPPDEGALAHAADRVLAGELPHRDFDAIYTGGLALLHGLAFRLLGVELLSMRLTLLLFACAWVPALYAIAARAMPPVGAGAVTLLCVAWSVPNYAASMPSWYNLFFATWGVLALLWHVDTGRGRWLVVAGMCGGLSALFKSTGLFFLAAQLLFLLYREQTLARSDDRRGGSFAFSVPAIGGLVLFAALLVALVSRRPSVMAGLLFALPGLALCGLLIQGEWRLRSRAASGRWWRAVGLGGPLAAGAALPVVLFALPYVASGSLPDLFRGVFVLPVERFQYIHLDLPALGSLVALAPIALLLGMGWRQREEPVGRGWILAAAGALGLVLAFGRLGPVYDAVWSSTRPLVPLVVFAICLTLRSGSRERDLSDVRCQELFLLAASAALVSLVQLPFPAGIYFCYVAPLVFLATQHFVASRPAAPRSLFGCLLVFYAAFAVIWNVPAETYRLGWRYHAVPQATLLDVERGGLRVSASDAQRYRRLVREVRARTAPGEAVYVTPDAPEVYFLADRPNPTRTLYDIFDFDYGQRSRTRRLMALLREHDVRVVVLRKPPGGPSIVHAPMLAALRARYPQRLDLPRFAVMWRQRASDGQRP